jgi:hypothetical protein
MANGNFLRRRQAAFPFKVTLIFFEVKRPVQLINKDTILISAKSINHVGNGSAKFLVLFFIV